MEGKGTMYLSLDIKLNKTINGISSPLEPPESTPVCTLPACLNVPLARWPVSASACSAWTPRRRPRSRRRR